MRVDTARNRDTNWLTRFRELGAVWEATKADAPHVKTSLAGAHVDRYFNSDAVLSWPQLTTEIVTTILRPELAQRELAPAWIVGYAPFGLFLAQAIAAVIDARCAYTDPSADYDTYFDIRPGEAVLVVADDMYSGGSVTKTIAQLEYRDATVLPLVFCLVNLSGTATLGGREILSAESLTANRYSAEQCPMCKQGSVALTPRPNWRTLQSPSAGVTSARADPEVRRVS